MASFLRGKQAGMQKDLSADILPQHFEPDEQMRYGINSQISCLAYDPVQSLLAVGTNESKYGNGKVYIFGQVRVTKSIDLPNPASVRSLHFCGATRLVSLDSRGELAVWDLDTASRIAKYICSAAVATVVTDPMLDWALIGYGTGEVTAYDLDRERLAAQFRLPNFWRQRDPKLRVAPALVSLQLHPRDIGKLLIGYTHGAVIYSFKQNAPTKFFEYQVPPGAPGGNGASPDSVRRPRLTQALWHPSGTFVLTAHDDGSLVFWDPKDGRVVMARSLAAVNVDQPAARAGAPAPALPFVKIAWCCKANPDDTALLIAGGQPVDAPEKGLTFLELGQAPVYATSSWQILSDHFKGKRQHVLPTPPGADVTNFCVVPRASPHYAGAQDPIAVLALLTSGEMITLSFPSGYPISPTNQLHPSLSFVHPFVTRLAISTLGRERWLGMVERRSQGELLVKGGAEGPRPRRRHEGRNIVQAAHADGTVRIWDLGHGDEIENPAQLQVDVARAAGRLEDVDVTAMHMATITGEFAAGTRAGEVVVYRWGGNRYFGRDEPPKPIESNPGGISDISSRAEPTLKEGLQPFVLYEMMQGPVTALSVSDVGFVAVGSENGFVSVLDLRGPSVIYQASMADFAEPKKRVSFIRGGSGSAHGAAKDWPVKIEFGVLTLEGDSYSSICCFVGTNGGRLVTLKLLPQAGGYAVKVAGVASLDDRVVAICPIVAATGQPAAATGPVVAGLRNGQQVHGTLVVVTQTEVRIFRPATAKGASKSFDDILCDAAAVTAFELHGFALVGLFGDRTARAFSLPGLREIGKAALPLLDATRLPGAAVAPTGDVVAWTGPSELAVVPVWGAGRAPAGGAADDRLVNPDLAVPPRPTISNLQWISGTQYVSPTDLDLLIGGPDRPPSKRMLEAAAAEAYLARAGGGGGGGRPRSGGGSGGGGGAMNPRAGTSQEGWGEYLSRQLNERTEKLSLMGDNMDDLQGQSAGWADDVSDFISKQKRNILLGGLKSRFL